MIFHGAAPNREGSDGATIAGNMIAGVKSIAGPPATLGVGIYLDATGTSRHTITGNVIKQCEGAGIMGSGGNNDVVVGSNVIDNTNSVVPGASISFHDAERITICGNKILNNQTGRPIDMKGTCRDWQIAGNSFQGNQNNTPAPLSVHATLLDNTGYNPVGTIADPWRPSGDLSNEGGGDTHPASGQVYTVRQSPKTIMIAAGAVKQIAIDGFPTGLSAGVFKLGIGETIAVSYTSTPSSKVSAD
jgi:hypothetical protein